MKVRLVTAGAGAAWEAALVHANMQEPHRFCRPGLGYATVWTQTA